MTRTYRSVALAALVLVVAGTSGVVTGTGPAASAEASGRPVAAAGSVGATVDVVSTYGRVDPLMQATPSQWGGAFVDDSGRLVVRYVGQSRSAAAAALARVGVPQTAVDLRAGTVSLTTLQRQQTRLSGLARTSGQLTSVGPDYAAGRLRVEGAGSASRLTSDVTRLLGGDGPAPVVTARPATPLPAAKTSSRYYDTGSLHGGGLINLTGNAWGYQYTSHCSTGFSWIGRDGAAYGLTAGHCFLEPGAPAMGTVSVRTSGSTTRVVGTVAATTVTKGTNVKGRRGDLAVFKLNRRPGQPVSALTSGRIYTGLGNSTTTRAVRGSVLLPQGYSSAAIRTSGSSGYQVSRRLGEISPTRITAVDRTITWPDGQQFTGITIAADRTEHTSAGDSGGAVYLKNANGTAAAVGIMSGYAYDPLSKSYWNYYTPLKYVPVAGRLKNG